MAIYEYYCPTCRDTFELRRPMSEATVATKCACGQPAERTISNFAVARGEGAAVAQMEPEFGSSGGCACGGGGCGCSS